MAEKRSAGVRELPVDRAIYSVDDQAMTYRYLRRNPTWSELSPDENRRNKMSLDGYTRVFRSGKTRRLAWSRYQR